MYTFDQEMFGLAPMYDGLMSCKRSSYALWCKMEISRRGENRTKPCRVCKKVAFSHVLRIKPTNLRIQTVLEIALPTLQPRRAALNC